MPNINKPFYALAYSALGVTLPPMAFKAAEIVSGFTFSSTIWKLVWLFSIVSLIILAGSLLYIIIYIVPVERLIYKIIHPIVSLFSKQGDIADTEAEDAADSAKGQDAETIEEKQAGTEELLDERHTMFQPYINEDYKDLPTMPVLDILDEVFKNINQKKDVGMALYCSKSLKWITAFPPYRQMAAIFGEEIVGSSSNFSTYMQPIREIDSDYGLAERDFLVGVKDMKGKLRKVAGVK